MTKGIYAILDKKANDIVANLLMLHANDAVATRSFAEIAQAQNSQILKYPEDFDLIRLGHLESGEQLFIDREDTYETILTGEKLHALINANTQLKKVE